MASRGTSYNRSFNSDDIYWLAESLRQRLVENHTKEGGCWQSGDK